MKYLSPTKQNWREWEAAQAARDYVPGCGAVIFLPGEGLTANLAVATLKNAGIHQNDLLAVEKDLRIANRLKAHLGLVVINANIEDVLLSWSKKIRLHAACLDFMCGMVDNLVEKLLAASLCHENLRKTRFVINMRHGREQGVAFRPFRGKNVHRGTMYKYYYESFLRQAGDKRTVKLIKYPTYKGDGAHMDAFSLRVLASTVEDAHLLRFGANLRSFEQLRSHAVLKNVKGKISAALAERTKRMSF